MDKARQFVDKYFYYCYLQGSGNARHKRQCIMQKKTQIIQALRNRTSGSGTSGRPTGVLWIAATRWLEEHVIWSDQKWLLLQTSPIKQNKRYWASVRHRVTVTCKEQGKGSRARRCCLFGIIRPANISVFYAFIEVDQDKLTSTT